MITPDHLSCHQLTLDIPINTSTNTMSTLPDTAFSHAPVAPPWPHSATQAPHLHQTNIPSPCTPAPHLLVPDTTSGSITATHKCMTTSCNPYPGSALQPHPCSWPHPPALPALGPMTYALALHLHMHDTHDITYDHVLHMTSPCITYD